METEENKKIKNQELLDRVLLVKSLTSKWNFKTRNVFRKERNEKLRVLKAKYYKRVQVGKWSV